MNNLEKYVNLNFLILGVPIIKNLFTVGACLSNGEQCSPLRDKFYTANDETLKNAYRLSQSLINKFKQIKKENPAKKEIEKCAKLGIKIITIEDEAYPEKLKNIFDPPLCLYYKGALPVKDELTIAVVGSRSATAFGKVNAGNISGNLASCGINIVSGMARGIDTHAHLGALKVSGRTTAVLGCGLNIIYPPENKKLMEAIFKNGAVISEFPLDTEPNAWNFPMRNRIISGLSSAVIVVEASDKSGSLITANCALEQGRDVFAMPGNTLSSVAKGVNKLIKEGARLVENAEDIFAELGIEIKAKNIKKEKNIASLTENERKIYSLLEESLNIEEISIKIDLPINILTSTLTIMESKGIIKKLPGNVHVRL